MPLLTSLVFVWLFRARDRLRATKPGELRHAVAFRIFSLLSVAFFVGLIVMMIATRNPTATWWVYLFFAAFTLLCLHMAVDSHLSRYTVTDSSLEYPGWLYGRRTLRWSDLVSVRYKHNWYWFTLKTNDGRTVHVQALLAGLPTFAAAVLAHARSAIADDSLDIFVDLATGADAPR